MLNNYNSCSVTGEVAEILVGNMKLVTDMVNHGLLFETYIST